MEAAPLAVGPGMGRLVQTPFAKLQVSDRQAPVAFAPPKRIISSSTGSHANEAQSRGEGPGMLSSDQRPAEKTQVSLQGSQSPFWLVYPPNSTV